MCYRINGMFKSQELGPCTKRRKILDTKRETRRDLKGAVTIWVVGGLFTYARFKLLLQKTTMSHCKLKFLFGEDDPYLNDKQLLPENLQNACAGNKLLSLNLRKQPGYDHGYYFISSFIEEHFTHTYVKEGQGRANTHIASDLVFHLLLAR
eukprot:sb/3473455/